MTTHIALAAHQHMVREKKNCDSWLRFLCKFVQQSELSSLTAHFTVHFDCTIFTKWALKPQQKLVDLQPRMVNRIARTAVRRAGGQGAGALVENELNQRGDRVDTEDREKAHRLECRSRDRPRIFRSAWCWSFWRNLGTEFARKREFFPTYLVKHQLITMRQNQDSMTNLYVFFTKTAGTLWGTFWGKSWETVQREKLDGPSGQNKLWLWYVSMLWLHLYLLNSEVQ